jgi:hypothetical protein
MKKQLLGRLTATAIALSALPAAAQTGRIAHLSHGGSPATLAAAVAADNFGIPTTRSEHAADSLVCLNDSMAMSYGRYRSVPYHASEAELQKASWRPSSYQMQYYSGRYEPQKWQEAVQYLQQRNKEARLVGFDKQLKTRGRKQRKSASQSQSFPKRPFQYSLWRAAVGVAGLGAVSWLLGRKRPA